MKRFCAVFSFFCASFLFFAVGAYSKLSNFCDHNNINNPRAIRDSLFKCDRAVIHKSLTALHTDILKKIDFQKADNKTIPSLALSGMKKINRFSKEEREIFIKSIIAVIKHVNKMIMGHRDLIILVKNNGESSLSEQQLDKFKMICSFYQTSDINELLRRVAPVPVSLAVAQAAIESGFGSDEYIHSKNAYFGMMKNSKELYSFDTLFESAIAYAKTLNVHNYYKKFREERFKMLNASKKIDGAKLCSFIDKYCVKKIYKKRILSLIKDYELSSQDQVYSYCGQNCG